MANLLNGTDIVKTLEEIGKSLTHKLKGGYVTPVKGKLLTEMRAKVLSANKAVMKDALRTASEESPIHLFLYSYKVTENGV